MQKLSEKQIEAIELIKQSENFTVMIREDVVDQDGDLAAKVTIFRNCSNWDMRYLLMDILKELATNR